MFRGNLLSLVKRAMAGRSIAQAIFGGKPPDPKEQAKQWRLKLKGEMRQLERQIKGTSPA